jgi:hypothetical protein
MARKSANGPQIAQLVNLSGRVLSFHANGHILAKRIRGGWKTYAILGPRFACFMPNVIDWYKAQGYEAHA